MEYNERRDRFDSRELTDSSAYRDKVYSSLHRIPDEAFQRGLARLDADLKKGPVVRAYEYTLVWGKA